MKNKEHQYCEFNLVDIGNDEAKGKVIEKIVRPEGSGGRDFNI